MSELQDKAPDPWERCQHPERREAERKRAEAMLESIGREIDEAEREKPPAP